MDDNFLWIFCAVAGIIIRKQIPKWLKYASWFGTVLIYLCGLHYASLMFIGQLENFNRVGVAFASTFIISIILLYLLYYRRERISKVLSRISKYRKLLHVPNGRSSSVLNSFLLLNIIFLSIISLITFATAKIYGTHTFWFYGFEKNNVITRNLMEIFGYFSYYVFYIYVPVFITLIICFLEYSYGEFLRTLNKELGNLLEAQENVPVGSHLKASYWNIIDDLRELNALLSGRSFALLLCNFCGILTGLSSLILYHYISRTAEVEIAVNTIGGTCMITAHALCGSAIPAHLKEIRITAGKLVEKYKKDSKEHAEDFFLFERMEKRKIIYMTAADMINIDKNLILKAFGSVLTYGLLIINLRTSDTSI